MFLTVIKPNELILLHDYCFNRYVSFLKEALLFLASNNWEGVIIKDSALSTYFDLSWASIATASVLRCCVDSTEFSSLSSLDSDESMLSPGWRPTVSDGPIITELWVCSVSHQLDSMVNIGTAGVATCVDT
jgi:hypothetical protein